MSGPRIPRSRVPVIPLGDGLRWYELTPFGVMRIALFSIAAGVLLTLCGVQ